MPKLSDVAEEFDKALMERRCKEYREKTATGEWKYPDWQLNYFCKQGHTCACFETDRRIRHRKGVAQKTRVAKKHREVGTSKYEAQRYRERLSKEYQRLKKLPPKKLKELAKEYSAERKAHPKLTNAVILQIAKDHLAYKSRPRKRWKRRKKR